MKQYSKLRDWVAPEKINYSGWKFVSERIDSHKANEGPKTGLIPPKALVVGVSEPLAIGCIGSIV